MRTIDKQSLNVNDFRKEKEKQFQKQIIFLFLMLHTTAASMVMVATGVRQKIIIRYKRDLEKNRLLQVPRKQAVCFYTESYENLLTTDY